MIMIIMIMIMLMLMITIIWNQALITSRTEPLPKPTLHYSVTQENKRHHEWTRAPWITVKITLRATRAPWCILTFRLCAEWITDLEKPMSTLEKTHKFLCKYICIYNIITIITRRKRKRRGEGGGGGMRTIGPPRPWRRAIATPPTSRDGCEVSVKFCMQKIKIPLKNSRFVTFFSNALRLARASETTVNKGKTCCVEVGSTCWQLRCMELRGRLSSSTVMLLLA